MDNAQKAIMIGVGLFITIIIIAAVMLITGMGQEMLQGGQEQVSNISKSLQAQLTADFDDSTITGAQVVTAIKRYYKDESMVLIVKNGTTTTNYGKVTATVAGDYTTTSITSERYTPSGIGALSDSSAAGTYAPSTAKYKSHVIKIAGSDNVVGLYFEK
ncbi:MAG: hypothetical protein PHP54_03465 [Clostridia bacterium]|nr:hypothetical protein [Clostridia bacterium]